MILPFYIGQRVVSLKNHSQRAFKKGQQFVVRNIRERPCGCGGYLIDIGIYDTVNINNTECSICSKRTPIEGNVWWFNSASFAPIQEDFKAISFTKILEEELVSVN